MSHRCSICKGKYILTLKHIGGRGHRSNIEHLPMQPIPWWTMTPQELKAYLHSVRKKKYLNEYYDDLTISAADSKRSQPWDGEPSLAELHLGFEQA